MSRAVTLKELRGLVRLARREGVAALQVGDVRIEMAGVVAAHGRRRRGPTQEAAMQAAEMSDGERGVVALAEAVLGGVPPDLQAAIDHARELTRSGDA
jgi:hypothetical protein